jgi:hypothetical protein
LALWRWRGIAAFGPARLIAQIEGDRGIAPVITTGDIEINGIQVDVQGKTAAEARQAGWHDAYKQAWAKAGGPEMGADAIGNLVSAVVVESEQRPPSLSRDSGHRLRSRQGQRVSRRAWAHGRPALGADAGDAGAVLRRRRAGL